MSKKGLKADDLLDLLQEDRVVEKLMTRLTPAIEAIVDKLWAKVSANLTGLVEGIAEEFLAKHLQEQSGKISTLETENFKLRNMLDEVESHSRLNNLVIHGLEDPSMIASPLLHQRPVPPESPYPEFFELCSGVLKVPVSVSDISFAYRIQAQAKAKVRPLVVGFATRRVRDAVLASRKTLRESRHSVSAGIYISEHLTRTNSQLYARARHLVKLHKCHSTWSSGGRILLKKSDSDKEKPTRVTSMAQLDELEATCQPHH